MDIGADKVFQSEGGHPKEILKQKDVKEKERESHLA
jgi:hypothetical protein